MRTKLAKFLYSLDSERGTHQGTRSYTRWCEGYTTSANTRRRSCLVLISRENLYNQTRTTWITLSLHHSLTMRYLLYIFIIIPSSLYMLLCLFMYFLQDQLLFFPSAPYLPHYEKLAKNPDLRNIRIQTDDGKMLDGWMQIGEKKPYTVLYFWGNGDETSYFVEKYRYKNANIVSFNYRGYAYSTGKPSEKALFADALTEYDYLIKNLWITPEKIIVMGRSLGTGVATYLASQRKVEGAILITPYASVESVAKESYSFLPVSLLITNPFRSDIYAAVQRNRLLCIYGWRDTIIPKQHTENLLTHWNGEIKKIFISDATHDNIYDFPEVESAINDFIPKK